MPYQPGLRELAQGFDAGLRILLGCNPDVGTVMQTLWMPGGDYPWLETAAPLRVRAGGNVNDTLLGTRARDLILQGLDGDGEEITAFLNLAGASASLETPESFLRLNAVIINEVGDFGTTNAGNVIIETNGGIQQAEVAAGAGYAAQGVFTVSAGKTLLLDDVTMYMSGLMDMRGIVRIRPEILEDHNHCWQDRILMVGGDTILLQQSFGQFFGTVPPLTDIEFRAQGGGPGVEVTSVAIGRLIDLYKDPC